MYENLVEGMRSEWGLAQKEIKLERLDYESGEDDEGLLWIIGSKVFDKNTRLETLDKLYSSIFNTSSLNPKRIGPFLSKSYSISKNPNTPLEFKKNLYQKLNPFLLDGLLVKSSIDRWQYEVTQPLLDTYCTFLNIDRVYGKDATRIKQEYVEKMISARALDQQCDISSQKGKNMINLPSFGAEVAQCGINLAFLMTTETLRLKGHIFPYYRSRALALGLMTPEQIVADLLRKKDAPKGAGMDITTLGGVPFVTPALANVSKQSIAAVGEAIGLRQDIIDAEGITYGDPQRTDAYRELKVQNLIDPMLVDIGDGSWIDLPVALELAALYRAPLIVFCQNNQVAIGTTYGETQTTPIYVKGKSVGTPGIRIESTDPDGVILATRFATLRAALDGGQSIIEVMTERPGSHSGPHGNHQIGEIIDKVQWILNKELTGLAKRQYPPDCEKAKKIRHFRDIDIFELTRKDSTLKLKERILKFLEEISE